MGRSESKQAFQQGSAQSAQNQQQGTQAFNAGQSAIGDVQSMAKDFAAKNPYGVGGPFSQAMRTISANSSNAGTNSIAAAMRQHALQTGQNEASYAPNIAEEARQASRDQAAADAQAEEKRMGLDTAYRGTSIQMADLAPQDQARFYGVATGGAGSNLSSAANAAKTPGFWDTFAPALVGGAAAVGKGFTPAGAGG